MRSSTRPTRGPRTADPGRVPRSGIAPDHREHGFPGTTDTEFLRANVPDEVRHSVAAMTPLGRLGHPEDIAAVVAYLAGPDASWLTGQNIRADGALI